MKISIIITTHNKNSSLQETLESIRRLSMPHNLKVELIVVDNASTDETEKIVRCLSIPDVNVIYLYEPKKGQSNARNKGIGCAQGEIIMWTDDDVRVPVDWIESLTAPIISGDADGVAGQIRLAPHLERTWMTKNHFWRLADTRFFNDPPSQMIGANMAFSRKVLQKVPEFDNQLGPGALGFADDNLFSYQMIEAGFSIVSSPTTVEHHFDPLRLSKEGWIHHAKATGRSAAYVYYHWNHQKVTFPYAKLLLKKLVMFLLLNFKSKRLEKLDPCDIKEAALTESIYFLEQYISESKKTKNYDYKGLSKRPTVDDTTGRSV